MNNDNITPARRSTRRTFFISVGATSVAAIAFGVGGAHAAAAAPVSVAPRFHVDYDESVKVTFTNGRRFDVIVSDRDGNVLEHHRHLTLNRLYRLRSNLFTITPASGATTE